MNNGRDPDSSRLPSPRVIWKIVTSIIEEENVLMYTNNFLYIRIPCELNVNGNTICELVTHENSKAATEREIY